MRVIRLLLMLVLLAASAKAQAYKINPFPGRPQPLLTTSVSVSASPSTVTFILAKGSVSTGSSAVTINSSWTLGLLGTVKLYAYFSSPASALVNQSASSFKIASSQVTGQCTTGTPTSFTAFTGTSPFAAGSSLQIFSQTSALGLLVNRSDNLNLRIDLSTTPQLPAGTYTGTLILQAQAL